MCPVNDIIPITHPAITPPPITPPIVPPPIMPPIIIPGLIMDTTGTAPIANQVWDGTKFIKTNGTNNIEITKTPAFAYILATFSPPPVVNVVNVAANAVFNPLVGYNLTILNAKAISNFTNSSYFGAAMQYLFMMYDVRDYLVKQPWTTHFGRGISGLKASAHIDVINLLVEMNKHPKNVPIPATFLPSYPQIKQVFIGNAVLREEDSKEFLTNFWADLNPTLQDYFNLHVNRIAYHAVTHAVIYTAHTHDEKNFFDVTLDIISSNKNALLEDAMKNSYEHMKFHEGINAIPYGGDRVFGYSFYEIKKLPRYLNVRLGIVDTTPPHAKHNHRLQINTTITLTAGGVTINYFFLAVIVHSGNTSIASHYTVLVYDDMKGSNFDYIYYSDKISTKVSIPNTSKTIPDNLYLKNPLDTAYLLLYADINHLN